MFARSRPALLTSALALAAAVYAPAWADDAKPIARCILTGDGVHLNDAGNKFVAETIIKALGE